MNEKILKVIDESILALEKSKNPKIKVVLKKLKKAKNKV